MGARLYPPDEALRLGLRPLPDVPWIGRAESARRRLRYEAGRFAYGVLNPPRDVKREVT